MRSKLGILAGVLAMAVPALGGAWSADKVYQADTGDPKLVTDPDGTFPGWVIPSGEMTGRVTRTPPGTIGGQPAEEDIVEEDVPAPPGTGDKGKLKYSTSGQTAWTFTSGASVTTAIIWKVYIDSAQLTSSSMPAVQIGNGATRYRLDFKNNVTGQSGCTLPGWVASDNTTITAGGKLKPNDPAARYLPMSMDAWHTIRFQVSPDGSGGSKFDAWLDEELGGSDWTHVSGSSTRTSTAAYVQWGVINGINGKAAMATNYVAWGQNDQIGDLPFSSVEICTNGLDDDGDGDVDCADSSCDCSQIPSICGATTDIFEKFNVYFLPDPGASGRVPPYWHRMGYGVPGYSDGDNTNPPGASFNKLTPDAADFGPYYYWNPGPYVDAENDPDVAAPVINQCIADCTAAGNTQTYCNSYCNNPVNADRLFRPSQPMRLMLDLYRVPAECLDKGGTNESCYAGSMSLQRQVKADDLASLPIDWSQPVTIEVSAGGIDSACCDVEGVMDGSVGKWETVIAYSGYSILDNANDSIEWGADGDSPNYAAPADYKPISITLAANQGSPPGPTTLSLAVNFDYTMLNLGQMNPPLQKVSSALFENARIIYFADLTKPLLHLSTMKFRHGIDVGTSPADDTFTVTNAMPVPGTPMNYSVTKDVAWLSVATENGDGTGTSTGEGDTVTVHYNTAGLAAGDYTGTITVSWQGMDKSPATLTVKVQVGPRIQLNASAFNHTVTMGNNVTADTFNVTNVGGGHLEYTVSDDADWLSVSPSAFTPPGLLNGESNQLTVTYSTASLGVGTYNATITVSDPDALPASKTISARIVVALARPDFDADGDVDQADFAMFEACFSGTGIPATEGFCRDLADLNGDTWVDSSDYLLFEGCASGPGLPFNHSCLP